MSLGNLYKLLTSALICGTSGWGQYVNALITGPLHGECDRGDLSALYVWNAGPRFPYCLLLSWVQYSSFQTQPRELREVKYIVQATSYYNKQDLNPGWQTESLGLFQYTLQHIKGPACSNEPQILATALWYWKPKSAPKSVVLFDLSCFSNWQVYIDHIFNVLWIGQQRTVVLMGSDYVFLCYIQ